MAFKKNNGNKTKMADVDTEAPETETAQASLQVVESGGIDAAYEGVMANPAGLNALLGADDADFQKVEETLVSFSDDPEEGVKEFRGVYLGSGNQMRRDAPPLPQLFFAAKGVDGQVVPKKVNATAILIDAFRTIPVNTPVRISYLGEEVIGKMGERIRYFDVARLAVKATATKGKA